MKKRYMFIPLMIFCFVFANQIVFASDCCPNPPPCEPLGTGTPGYWKNHPEAWPVDSINIGGVTYTKNQAILIMNLPVNGDKTITMFRALVAAILNTDASRCNEYSCILEVIQCANIWMHDFPPQSGVKASSDAWQKGTCCPSGEWLYLKLDAYNNGLLCAEPRK